MQCVDKEMIDVNRLGDIATAFPGLSKQGEVYTLPSGSISRTWHMGKDSLLDCTACIRATEHLYIVEFRKSVIACLIHHI